MTEEQTMALLAYASAIDPRVRRNDPAERRLQVRAWNAQLAAVDLADGFAAVDAHYATPGASAALPGDIAGRARALRATARRERLEHTPDTAPQLMPAADPDDVPAYVAELRARRAAAADGDLTPAGDLPDARVHDLQLHRVFRAIEA